MTFVHGGARSAAGTVGGVNVPGWIQRVWSPQASVSNESWRRRLIKDILWWTGLAGPVLALMLSSFGSAYTGWDVVVVLLGFGVTLGLRHTVPVAAFLTAVTLATWSSAGLGENPDSWQSIVTVCLFILGYLVGRADSGDHSLPVQFTAMAVLVLALSPMLGVRLQDSFSLVVFLVFTILLPWLVGRYRFQHAQLINSGWQRAEQLEREQRAVAEQARLRERTRIAEDMHDSLGHELSLIALRAAALEVDATLPDRHQAAAGQLRQSAAVATERLRQIIGLLRDESQAASTTPVDESVFDLVERARGSGMDIDLAVDGDPTGLPRMVDRAVHRVVQESLTNAAKHAPSAPVTVRIGHAGNDTVVSIGNDLPPQESEAGIGGGRGLVGLTERVRLAGGVLRSGPRDGRFEVEARLPHSGEDPATGRQPPTTESAQRHVQVRVQTRRRLITVFVMPSVLLAALGGVFLAVVYVGSLNSVLPPGDYELIRVGQTRESVETVLPPFDMLDPPDWVEPPGTSPISDCDYYPAHSEVNEYADVFQLCYMDDKLVGKQVITVEEREQHFEDSHSR